MQREEEGKEAQKMKSKKYGVLLLIGFRYLWHF